MEKEKTTQKKLISIIVPIYNVEKYLPKCIDSILNQTYKNLEIILINDGSNDNSGKICDEYALKDNRIRVFHKENGGISTTRNKGIEMATGELIGFVDSDDWIAPNMYESLYELMEKNNADIVQCDYINAVTENPEVDKRKEEIKIFTNIEGLNNLYNHMHVSTLVVWNKLYKKSLFDGIFYQNGKIHEDDGTTYKLIYKANKIVYTNMQYYFYRKTPNSITNKVFNKKRFDILDIYEERIEFMKNINDEALYATTIKWYFFKVINLYFECNNYLSDEKDILDMIKDRVNNAYSLYMSAKERETRWVVLFKMFKFNPNLYQFIINKINR